jgi:hypothetical protein
VVFHHLACYGRHGDPKINKKKENDKKWQFEEQNPWPHFP